MLIFRPYGACLFFGAYNYKHFVPNGTENCPLLTAY
jgi:hypothetical protein